MKSPSAYAFAATVTLATAAVAQTTTSTASSSYPTAVVGTWSTKSNKTLTGPGFFDPTTDTLIEPSLTGFSYSFTDDGYYEEAYYRAIANPANPKCPSGIMQWQHGSYTVNSTGSIFLTPIEVDGRQLLSEPCDYDYSTYTRYNQSETFASYSQYTDPYHNIPRLDLYAFDGSPLNPMYLAYDPPQMLPTTTLLPTSTSGGAKSTSTSTKRKRGLNNGVPLNFKMQKGSYTHEAMNPDRWWWIGLSLTGFGGLLYFGPRRMGIQL